MAPQSLSLRRWAGPADGGAEGSARARGIYWGAGGVGSRSSVVRLLASATTASADASLTPVVDCVVPQGINATTNKVYFGYTNAGLAVSVPFGDSNQIVPGI